MQNALQMFQDFQQFPSSHTLKISLSTIPYFKFEFKIVSKDMLQYGDINPCLHASAK